MTQKLFRIWLYLLFCIIHSLKFLDREWLFLFLCHIMQRTLLPAVWKTVSLCVTRACQFQKWCAKSVYCILKFSSLCETFLGQSNDLSKTSARLHMKYWKNFWHIDTPYCLIVCHPQISWSVKWLPIFTQLEPNFRYPQWWTDVIRKPIWRLSHHPTVKNVGLVSRFKNPLFNFSNRFSAFTHILRTIVFIVVVISSYISNSHFL